MIFGFSITASSGPLQNAMIRFRVWSNEAIDCDINLINQEERAMYSVCFELPANTWTDVQRRIDKAYYRLQGVPDIPNNGLVGDHISQIQIATRGTKVMMGSIEIVVAEDDEKEFPPESRPETQTRESPAEFIKRISEETGFLYGDNTPEELSDMLYSLIKIMDRAGKNIFNSMVYYAASYVRENYSWQKVAQKYTELYESLK